MRTKPKGLFNKKVVFMPYWRPHNRLDCDVFNEKIDFKLVMGFAHDGVQIMRG